MDNLTSRIDFVWRLLACSHYLCYIWDYIIIITLIINWVYKVPTPWNVLWHISIIHLITLLHSMGTINRDIQTMGPLSKKGKHGTLGPLCGYIEIASWSSLSPWRHAMAIICRSQPIQSSTIVLLTSGDSHPPTFTLPMLSLCFGSVQVR